MLLPNQPIRSEARNTRESLAVEFAQPSAEYRGKPFWCWNGDLEREELLRQLRIFKTMGMGGAFMHSRTGLQTEYLGEKWFELINACADEAERIGLEAWLYDEDRWPSGSAGGMATIDPANRMRSLRLTTFAASNFIWPEKDSYLHAFSANLSGLSLGTYHLMEHGANPLESGKSHVLLFTIEVMEEHSFYNNNTYLDTLQKESTEVFLATTHAKYKSSCGDRLGQSIRGIFTDEPHRGMVMCENNEAKHSASAEWTVPFTPKLFAEFEQLWGYDLQRKLPELFLWPNGHQIAEVKWHFMELLQRMFIENWAKPCQDWCQENGLQLTGHVLHEDSLVAQAVPGGSAMRYYEFLDTPGIDILGNNNRSYWVAKQLQSAGRQLGKKTLLSELYGCAGWHIDFAKHKELGFWQALFGVNLRCHHLSWYSMAGEAKRDFPASISFQSAWHEEYRTVEDFFSRLHVIVQHGEPIVDVLVVNPVESVWAQIHPGWAQWLEGKGEHFRALQKSYEDLFHLLTRLQIDFDYGDEDHLARFGHVDESGPSPRLCLGHGSYGVIVVSGMDTIRSTTMDLINQFHSQGGEVIFVGTPPTHMDAIASPLPQMACRRAQNVPLNLEALRLALRPSVRVPIEITGDTKSIISQIRCDSDGFTLIAINTDACEGVPELSFSALGPFQVEEWDCDSGQCFAYPSQVIDGITSWGAPFAALGTRVFRVVTHAQASLPFKPSFHGSGEITLEGPFPYQLSEPNLCVLDHAEFCVGDSPWQSETEILKIDQTVRASLGIEQRAGNMVQPWAAAKMGLATVPRSAPLKLQFTFTAEQLPVGPVFLVIEQPEAFRIFLNERLINIPEKRDWLIDPSLEKIPLPSGALKTGTNTIQLHAVFVAQLDLEAIYIAGDFGVSLDEGRPILRALPKLVSPSDLVTQGFPFYSGIFSYELPLPDRNLQLGFVKIRTGEVGGAVAKIRHLGAKTGEAIAWSPYEAVIAADTNCKALICDVFLTRANTFGPLHIVPKERESIGPISFRTEGNSFSRQYQLWPSGLLQPPRLTFGNDE